MTAKAMVVRDTGEVIPLDDVGEPFDLAGYLSRLHSPAALKHQNQLAAAYDAACAALIGPNDVQVEKGRTFKKKSAWRKLARAFRISVAIPEDRVQVEELASGHFLASVIARASAPWGQVFEEIGACCTDEATGRRVISKADAIATASTRASNRAISNLIAMGEVSAEELEKDRPAAQMPEPTLAAAAPIGRDTPCPFDPKKRPLAELAINQLRWVKDKAGARIDEGDEGAEVWYAAVTAEIDSRKP
jgi:hypothetical protein